MDAVVLNCVTQFNIVFRVRTFPFLPMSKCRQKTHCVTVAESLFLKNVSTANARCSSNQRCMMTEGFKPLYPAMCVSPCHLHRCQHGAKFKLFNCFCPTLYMLLMSLVRSGNVNLTLLHWLEYSLYNCNYFLPVDSESQGYVPSESPIQCATRKNWDH
jgi:hypothetical protein